MSSSAAKSSAPKPSEFEVYQAGSAADRQRVYAFRYKVLVEDLGETLPEADHDAKVVCGPLDDPATILVLATRKGEIIATVRLNLNASSTLLPAAQSLLMIDRFASFGPAALAYSSCLAVSSAWRGSPVLSLLVGAAYKLSRARGVRFDFVAATPGNLPVYERLGYRRHAPTLTDGGSLKSPMVLLLEDFRYLKEIGSPLWRLAVTEQNSTETATWFMRAFPDVHRAGPTVGMSDDEFWVYLSKRLSRAPLESVPLLDGLTHADAKRFVASGTTVRCKDGDWVLRAGSRSHEMYVVLSGELEVCTADGEPRTVARLGVGDVFGEVGYLSEVKRSANVIARSAVEVLVLSQETFRRVMSDEPALAAKVLFNLSLILSRRLAEALSTHDVAASSPAAAGDR